MLLKNNVGGALLRPMAARCFSNVVLTLPIAYKQLEVRLVSFHILQSLSSYCPLNTSQVVTISLCQSTEVKGLCEGRWFVCVLSPVQPGDGSSQGG